MVEFSPAHRRFERTLAWHCAPSLTGIKAADMICWEPPAQEAAALSLLQHYTAALARRGVCLYRLTPRSNRLLILTFRPEPLQQCLSRQDVRAALKRDGYPVGEDSDPFLLLNHLQRRLKQADFPHEIGLFLGYPAADVEGFRIHNGRNCKFSGCWKVYGDADYAQRMFAQFFLCRQALSRRVESGWPLEQLLPSAPPPFWDQCRYIRPFLCCQTYEFQTIFQTGP